MTSTLLTILRNKDTKISAFRKAARKLSFILAGRVMEQLEKDQITIETPIAKTNGCKLKNNIVLIPILRSGIALLDTFFRFFEDAKIGFIGLKRDEQTAIPHLYYDNLPKIENSDDIIVLDPMIATGGSACAALKILKDMGLREEKMIFVAVIGTNEGIAKIQREFPKIKILCFQEDQKLNDKKYIVPGLGDFGDRYFGTVPEQEN